MRTNFETKMHLKAHLRVLFKLLALSAKKKTLINFNPFISLAAKMAFHSQERKSDEID
jgi:hypothetical protein